MRNPGRHATRGTRYASATASALLCAVFLVGIAGLRGNAQTPDALPYSTGYLVTGNYVVGGVDFTPLANPPDGSGLATGTIHMSGVPANAEILAAELYWEAIYLAGVDPTAGVKFRDTPIGRRDSNRVPPRCRAIWLPVGARLAVPPRM